MLIWLKDNYQWVSILRTIIGTGYWAVRNMNTRIDSVSAKVDNLEKVLTAKIEALEDIAYARLDAIEKLLAPRTKLDFTEKE